MTLQVSALAKINLHLRVLDRRDDGFHEIQTLLQTIGLADEVQATPAPRGVLELQVEPAGAVSRDNNLVLRAAKALRSLTGVEDGARIELLKRLPIGAGFGGGSSNAAATLVLLTELWGLHLEPKKLMDLATGLGSDVPFFLSGGLAFATGRGEMVQPLPDLPEYGVVLCVPQIEVSTAKVYDGYAISSQLTSARSDASVDAFVAGSGNDKTPPWRDLKNDLEPSVIDRWPEVGRAVASLRASRPLHAALTGSGSASFAVFPDLVTARAAAEGLEDCWHVHVVSTVGRERGRPIVKRIEEERQEELA